ncbi:MAG: hypothetical protein FWG07_04965 [Treponema sp.]|nr:hypothetical protein [Treponema sp.]
MTRRNILLCLAWIGSALVIGFLLWFFTLSYRTKLLTQRVNKALAQSGVTGLAGGGLVDKPYGFLGNPVSVMGGSWFALNNSSDRAFVFSIMQNGIAAACVALVDNEDKVRSIIPLSENARQIIDELRLPVYRFYVDRIERNARNMTLKKGVLR